MPTLFTVPAFTLGLTSTVSAQVMMPTGQRSITIAVTLNAADLIDAALRFSIKMQRLGSDGVWADDLAIAWGGHGSVQMTQGVDPQPKLFATIQNIIGPVRLVASASRNTTMGLLVTAA